MNCVSLACSSRSGKTSTQTPADTLWFTHISMMGMGKTPQYFGWKTPHFLLEKAIGFKFSKNSLIIKFNHKPNGELVIVDTLVKISKTKSLPPDVSELKQSYLDYELLGVYHYKSLPPDIFVSLYYSPSRNSLIQQLHVSEIHRISDVDVLSNGNGNPFAEKNSFRVMIGDENNHKVQINEVIIVAPPKQ